MIYLLIILANKYIPSNFAPTTSKIKNIGIIISIYSSLLLLSVNNSFIADMVIIKDIIIKNNSSIIYSYYNKI